jgi:hypothetical protein
MMSQKDPKQAALRDGGFQTKNANYDGSCPACDGVIDGKTKHPVVAVANRWNGSRKQRWIHISCLRQEDGHPDTGNSVVASLTKRGVATVFDGEEPKSPPKETPKETPPPKVKTMPQKQTPAPDATKPTEAGDALSAIVLPSLLRDVTGHIEQTISDGLAALNVPRALTVQQVGDLPEVEVGLAHPRFDVLLDLARIRQNVLAVGPAGSGKTFAAEQVFQTLCKMDPSSGGFTTDTPRFTVVSCYGEMMPSDIVGPMVPNVSDGSEKHRITEAVLTYRDGGVLVWDEFDSLVGDTAIAANAALSGESWTMPDGTVIRKHPDFVCMATANTFGQGKGRGPYGSRNTLDGATLNRFAGGVIRWGYDLTFERALIGDDEVVGWFHDLRTKAESCGLDGRIVGPRNMMAAARQKNVLGWSKTQWTQQALRDWSEKDLRTVGMDSTFINETTSFGGAA